MPENITNYVLQERPIQPSIDLNVLNNSLSTIHKGNLDAIQAQSKLKKAIADMDLNEAEDGFRQQLYDDITKTIEENSIAGNAYYALDDIIAKAGDIDSNPGLIGRLNAQAAYKKNIADLDERAKRGEITRDTAEWAKSLNPYHYEDNYQKDSDGNVVLDEEGNPKVIGGSTWTPTMSPVKDIDFNDVLKLAAAYTSPDAGGGTSVTFIDANGKPTTNPTNAIATLNKATNTWERLSPEKLRQGVAAAMNANPEYAAGLRQAYKVLEWKAKTGQNADALFDAKTGAKKNFNQFIDDMINPFLRAKSYNHSKSTIDYNDAALAAFNKLNNPSGSGLNDALRNPGDHILTTAGHDIEWKDYSRAQALKSIDAANVAVKDLITKYDKDGKVDLSQINIRNEDNMKTYLKQSGFTDNEINDVIKFARKQVNDNADAYRYYDRLLEQNNKVGAATIMSDYMKNGADVDDQMLQENKHLNEYYNQYNKLINDAFDGREYLGFRMNKKEYERFISNIAENENGAKALGYKIINDGNRYTVALDREHGSLYSQFMEAIDKTHSETSWWNRNISKRDNFVRFDEGERQHVILSSIPTGVTAVTLTNYYEPLNKYNRFKNKLNRNKDLAVNPDSYVISGINAAGLNPKEYRIKEGLYSAETKEDAQMYTALDKAFDTAVENVLNPANFINTRVYLVKDGQLTELDSSKKQVLHDMVEGKAASLGRSMFYNPAEGKITPQLTYEFKGKEKNPFTDDQTALVFTSDGLINDRELNELNKSDDYAASSLLYRNNLNNINTDIGYYINENGNAIHYSLTPVKYNYNKTNYRDLVLDDGTVVIKDLTEDTSKEILKTFSRIKELSDIITSPDISPEIYDYTAITLAGYEKNSYAKLLGDDIVKRMINTYSE